MKLAWTACLLLVGSCELPSTARHTRTAADIGGENSTNQAQPLSAEERLLANPRPHGLIMGVDTPASVARKLGVIIETGHCPDARPWERIVRYCWYGSPVLQEAKNTNFFFDDVGTGSVLSSFWINYPSSSWQRLERASTDAWGPPDSRSNDRLTTSLKWDWGHTKIEISYNEQISNVNCSAYYTAVSARVGNARSLSPINQAVPPKIANPFGIRMGYDTDASVEGKLRAAGANVVDCNEATFSERPFRLKECNILAPRGMGLQRSTVSFLDLGDGNLRVAQLKFTLDRHVLENESRELTNQYGPPIFYEHEGREFLRQWWTGPVGVEMTASDDACDIRYFYGRFRQFVSRAANWRLDRQQQQIERQFPQLFPQQ